MDGRQGHQECLYLLRFALIGIQLKQGLSQEIIVALA